MTDKPYRVEEDAVRTADGFYVAKAFANGILSRTAVTPQGQAAMRGEPIPDGLEGLTLGDIEYRRGDGDWWGEWSVPSTPIRRKPSKPEVAPGQRWRDGGADCLVLAVEGGWAWVMWQNGTPQSTTTEQVRSWEFLGDDR